MATTLEATVTHEMAVAHATTPACGTPEGTPIAPPRPLAENEQFEIGEVIDRSVIKLQAQNKSTGEFFYQLKASIQRPCDTRNKKGVVKIKEKGAFDSKDDAERRLSEVISENWIVKSRNKSKKKAPNESTFPTTATTRGQTTEYKEAASDGRVRNGGHDTRPTKRQKNQVGVFEEIGHLRAENAAKDKELSGKDKLIDELKAALAAVSRSDEPTATERRASELVGLPYQLPQERATFYNHLKRLQEQGSNITHGNVVKLGELAQAMSERLGGQVYHDANHDGIALLSAVKDLLQLLNTKRGTNKHGEVDGRISNELLPQYDTIYNLLYLASKKEGVSQQSLVNAIGGPVQRGYISRAGQRLKKFMEGCKDALVRWRGAVRSDKLDPAWEKHATEFWSRIEISRPSECKASVRNPHDRGDKTRYIKRYLMMRVADEHALMVKAGKEEFGEDFHLSMTRNSELRPFFIYDGVRDTCLCIYHLKFKHLADALYNFRKGLRDAKKCQCTTPLLAYDADLRHVLVCERPEGAKVYQRACANNTCGTCSNAKRLSDVICNCIADCPDATIKWMEYTSKGTGNFKETDDGREEEIMHSEFVEQTTSFSVFRDYFETYWPEYIAHHDLAQWQDFDWTQQCENMPRGMCCSVEDFPENYTHEMKCEPQSAYWDQLQSGMYVQVLGFHLDDLINVTDEERAELHAMFDKEGIPEDKRIVFESHIGISADTSHTSANVQHFNNNFTAPYIAKNAPTVTTRHARSDGCTGQYKGRKHFGYLSSYQHDITAKCKLNWSWFCSCHGKCLCDPEGALGTLNPNPNQCRAVKISLGSVYGQDGVSTRST